MDCSSRINTCLALNINPRRSSVHEEVPKKETESNLISMGMRISCVKEESGPLVQELKRVSAENNKLTEMLAEMCENYNTLRGTLMDYMGRNPGASSKKRKSESSNNNRHLLPTAESSLTDEESCKKPREAKVSRVYVRTQASDTGLIVKDGYQWRKYGQKVTRDNPSPRAYFKCSFAPSCPVKKKVQRSVEDQSVVVATYEGEHNHPLPCQMEPTSASSTRTNLAPPPTSKSSTSNDSKNLIPKIESPQSVPQILVEQMATSLTKDPNFRAALVAAISGRMSHKI